MYPGADHPHVTAELASFYGNGYSTGYMPGSHVVKGGTEYWTGFSLLLAPAVSHPIGDIVSDYPSQKVLVIHMVHTMQHANSDRALQPTTEMARSPSRVH